MDTNPDQTVDEVRNFFAASFGAVVVVSLVVWICIALIAYWVAPNDRAASFLWCTLVILGPLGVAVALLAQPRKYN
jgi:hypothetical protein